MKSEHLNFCDKLICDLEYAKSYFDRCITIVEYFRNNQNTDKYDQWDKIIIFEKVCNAARIVNYRLPAIDYIDLEGLDK